MKRFSVIPAIIITVLFLFSCKKNEASISTNNADSDNNEAASKSSETLGHGFIMRVNASLMTLSGEDTGSESDKTEWSAQMALGEEVTVIEARKATWNGTVSDFLKVRRDNGKEGLAFASQVVVGGKLAVVVDERANTFTSPRSIDVTGTILPQKSLAVYFPETERNGFVEAKVYEYRQNFVRTNAISERQSDIQSVILIQTAESLGNTESDKIRKEALLESALLEYPDSVFNLDIQRITNPNAAVVIQTESVGSSRIMFVNEDRVNVRDLPDSIIGKIVYQLDAGEQVAVSERTIAVFTIGGQSAHWFHLSAPVDGWVFGAFLVSSL